MLNPPPGERCGQRITVRGRRLGRWLEETVHCEKNRSHVTGRLEVDRLHLGTLSTLRGYRVDLRWLVDEAGRAIIAWPDFVEEVRP